jgi:hypothetical protein
MLDLRTLKDTTATISDEALATLKASFSGRVIAPGDAAYDEARQVWNSLIDRRPGLIVQARGLADVVAAVRFARSHGLLVSVRGGGHNVSGSAVCDGGIVIDLREMRAVRVDRKTMTVHVQGGARLADVDRETQLFGLVAPTGNVSDTGVGGLTLCGGMSNLRRKWGLAVDNLVSVEIVTASGEVKTANADENSDLFWAVRGGGGNFGIVTSFEFRLHPLAPEVYFAAQFFAIDDAPNVMRKWRDFVEASVEEISSIGFFWAVPAVDGFPPELRGKRVFLYGAYMPDRLKPEKGLARCAASASPCWTCRAAALSRPGKRPLIPSFLRGPVYPEIYAYWKSIYLKGLDDTLVDDLVGRGKSAPTDQCLVALWHWVAPSPGRRPAIPPSGSAPRPTCSATTVAGRIGSKVMPSSNGRASRLTLRNLILLEAATSIFPGSALIPTPSAKPTVPTMTAWQRSRWSMIRQTCSG